MEDTEHNQINYSARRKVSLHGVEKGGFSYTSDEMCKTFPIYISSLLVLITVYTQSRLNPPMALRLDKKRAYPYFRTIFRIYRESLIYKIAA